MVKTFLNEGSGTSPIIAGDRRRCRTAREGFLPAGVRTDNGETVWRAPKPEWNSGWATPIVWSEAGETLVGVLNPGRFTAHSLRDGSERWWLGDLPRQTCATPVVGDGVLFLAASGRAGEKDNVTLPPSFDEMVARYDQDKNGLIEVDEIPETLLVTDRQASKGAGNTTVRRLLTFFAGDKPLPKSYDRAQWDAILKGTTEFVEGPFMKAAQAVRVGGKGDVAYSPTVGRGRGIRVPSPLALQGSLYLVETRGLVVSREAAGKTVFQGRGAPSGSTSPIAAPAHRRWASARKVESSRREAPSAASS